MLHGYYIVPYIKDSEKGILKKFGYHMDLFGKYTNIEKIIIPENRWVSRIIFRLPIGSSGADYKTVLMNISNPDYIYIRMANVDRKLIKFLSELKHRFTNCKILIEIPTFPYDKDALGRPRDYFILKKNRYYRNKLSNYIDRIVTYSKDDTIFGVQTIKTHNGIDCNKVEAITNYTLIPNTIRLIGVAQFRPQHGYERLIRGFGDYYKTDPKVKVLLTLVGNGAEKPFYENEAKKAGVTQYVSFTGSQTGDALNALYNNCDIAVSSLGMYKLGLDYVSTLKNCEYLAKGLPILIAYDDYAIDDNDMILKLPNNDSNIDISLIVDFYHRIYANGKKTVIEKQRNHAFEKADISKSYQDVIKYILGSEI